MPSRAEIAAEIDAQLTARGAGRTICPSEVARALAEDWRPLMDAVRAVADEMVGRGAVVVTQRGRRLDAVGARGPIRLGRP